MSKPKHPKRYAPEFRQQMVELVRAGRKPAELSKEFGCSVWSIRGWVKQSDRDAGRGDGGLTSAEREELTKLKREVRSSSSRGKFCQKPRPGSHRRSRRTRSPLRIRESEPGQVSGTTDVPTARSFCERFLCLG